MVLDTLNPDTDLVLERTLRAPRDLVWDCWTTPEHLPHFFVPRPHKVTACTIDLRPGGAFDTTFDVEGATIENKGVWLEVVPKSRLVFTDSFTAGWKPAENPFMTAILMFSDAPEGGTHYTAIARHRTVETCLQHKDMGFFEGWGTVVDQLDAYALSLAG